MSEERYKWPIGLGWERNNCTQIYHSNILGIHIIPNSIDRVELERERERDTHERKKREHSI